MRVRTHPGEVLRHEYLEPLELSATALAEKLDVPTNRITDIIRGRRDVTADTALRLADFFNTTPEFWMSLQTAHDLSKAEIERARKKSIARLRSRIFTDLSKTKEEKSVAASVLTQTKSPRETTSKGVAAAASKILHDPKASKDAKSVAASALTHKVKHSVAASAVKQRVKR